MPVNFGCALVYIEIDQDIYCNVINPKLIEKQMKMGFLIPKIKKPFKILLWKFSSNTNSEIVRSDLLLRRTNEIVIALSYFYARRAHSWSYNNVMYKKM